MARRKLENNSEYIIEPIDEWRNKCLLNDRSLFSDESLWKKENFDELIKNYVENPVTDSDKGFYEKLEIQLQNCSPETIKLTAECIWLLYILVEQHTISVETKIKRIKQIWELSGEEFPESQRFLNEKYLVGLLAPGLAFKTMIWKELSYLITTFSEWKALNFNEREKLLSDKECWNFCEFATSRENGDSCAFRHMLLYMVFPKYFEAIASKNFKTIIYLTFRDFANNDEFLENNELCTLDKTVHEIRKQFEKEHGDNFSFFKSPWKNYWKPDEVPQIKYWIENIKQKWHTEEENERGIGEVAWSPTKASDGSKRYEEIKEAKPGDIVFHFVNDKGLVGVSKVKEECKEVPGNDFERATGTPWEGRESFYAAELDQFQSLDPILLKEQIFENPKTSAALRKFLDVNNSKKTFFNKRMNIQQGSYFTEAPRALIIALNMRYKELNGIDLPYLEGLNPAVDTRDRFSKLVQDINFNYEGGKERLRKIIDVIKEKKSVVFYGPPGTGKTFIASKIAEYLTKGKRKNWDIIQFHQSYSYEEFMEGFRPTLNKEQESLNFQLKSGRFKTFCEEARKAEDEKPFVFIIDEFNRGNVTKIFGELMYLLEYRQESESIVLPYSGKRFWIPPNVYIIGTMNTADRSLAIMDFALRRRFAFLRFDPEYQILRTFLKNQDKEELAEKLIKMLAEVNRKITDKDFHIGISYFMKKDLNENHAKRIWEFEIETYLEELFHEDTEKIKELRWKSLSNNV
jgi:5-methylcytosine-specific restriction protein B